MRKAISRKRLVIVSKLNSVVSKISSLGQNRVVVPVSSVASCLSSSPSGTPKAKAWVQRKPSRLMSTSTRRLSALTTETPTPCRPPETL